MYQYGSEVYTTGLAYEYGEGNRVIVNGQVEQGEGILIDRKIETSVINRVGYAVATSYRFWEGERFTGRVNVKAYTFDRTFFGELSSVSFQVGYTL